MAKKAVAKQPKDPKPKKGPRAKKPDTTVVCKRLIWPPGQKTTKPEDREEGPYRCKRSPAMIRDNVYNVQRAEKQLASKLKTQNVPWVTVTWNLGQDLDEGINPKHEAPGVAVYYESQGKHRVVACDKYLTIVSNFRACIETIHGFFLLSRAGCVLNMGRLMESFTTQALVVRKKPKAESLLHFREVDLYWADILGLTSDQMDRLTGLPQNRKLLQRALHARALLYHQDAKETDPDNGKSMTLIQQAYAYVMKMMDRLENMGKQQEEAKLRARQEAEERSEKRTARLASEARETEKLLVQAHSAESELGDDDFDQRSPFDADIDQTLERAVSSHD